MKNTSKTGLLACQTKKIQGKIKKKSVQLKAIASPAPCLLRPYAGLYNPYPYGCSLLCNHPTDKDAKDILKRARETWATENKNVISPSEVQAIRDSLSYVESKPGPLPIENIPEELFRRYTETDSRPLTPAPTLASVKTRGSSSRRCVTPDPITTSVLHERTLLILDLRRSHSQEIISWQGQHDVPAINVLQAPTPSISIESPLDTPDIPSRKNTANSKLSSVQQQKLEVPKAPENNINDKIEDERQIQDGEEDVVKRKGKRRKKRGRDSSRGPLAVQASIDPETQVSTLGYEYAGSNACPPLISAGSVQNSSNYPNLHSSQQDQENNNYNLSNSYLQLNVLKHLQRELNSETLDLEFDIMRRAALEEAYKNLPVNKKQPSNELITIQKELNLPPIDAELWMSLPRVFSRRSVRFELPLHSRTLEHLTPLEYLKQHCFISSGRKLLYNLIFNRHKKVSSENDRILCNENLKTALGEMMGKPLTDSQINKFRELINLKDDDIIDFKIWCGMCALFERVFAAEFCVQLPGKDIDSCNEVEIADFQSLYKRLQHVTPNECLVKMLNAIKDL